MADLTSNQVCNICCIHYSAGLRCCALGTTVEGGRLFAKSGGVAWIVAPASTQVTRSWYLRDDAVTVAQAAAACGDWFVPSRTDLTFGNNCKSFWDSANTSPHWSSTETDTTNGFFVAFLNNGYGNCLKSGLLCVRAFRRVFY